MGYFPIFLELADRPCLVIGGGPVAERKVQGLLRVGASVTVVSPTLSPRLRALAAEGHVRHLVREYRATDLAGFALAFVATDDRDVNAAVARDGAACGVWVNAADDATHSDFILPSVLRRGELTVAVGTRGASPAVARAIREELEHYFTDDHEMLLRIAAEARLALRQEGRAPDGETWQAALTEVRGLIAEGRPGDARDRLRHRLGTA